jgi:ATP/maltotriose-dependent transcriptional regulator MalT
VAQRSATGRDAARFALTKFRRMTLPTTLLTRSALHGRLEAGASQRLTVVVGSAGAGKSVLLSSWAAARKDGVTSWLSCDEADADPVRFWAGFIEAPQAVAPGFGADAGELLAMDGVMSADVTASIANDAAKLPAGSVIIVDDFHAASARTITDLVERWPVTGRQDAAALLRSMEAASLFVVALDDDRTSYRYHHLVRDVLRAELHATDRARELELQLRTAEWLESAGDTRRATRHFLAARQVDRALALLQDRVATDFLRDPAVPAALDLSMVDPALLAGAPDRLLALAADLTLW